MQSISTPPVRWKPLAPVAALLLGIAVLLPRMLTGQFVSSGELLGIQAGIIFAVAVGPVLVRIRRREIEFCDISIFIVFGYLLHFVMGSITPLFVGSTFLDAQPGDPEFAWLNIAAFIATLAIACFHLGYFSTYGTRIAQRFKDPPAEWNSKVVLGASTIAIAIGLAVQAAMVLAAFRGVASGAHMNLDEYRRDTEGITYLGVVGNLTTLGILALVILNRRYGSRPALLINIAALPMQLLLQFFSGSRSGLGFFLLGLVIAYYLTSQRDIPARRRYTKFFGLALLFFLILFPLVGLYRFAGSGGVSNVAEAAGEALTVDRIASQVAERFHGVSSLAILAKRVPHEKPFQFGIPYGDVLIAWIPRAVWKEKPMTDTGLVFAAEIVPPGVFPPGSSVATTIPGEFYWNFGLPGVLIGMWVFGIAMRILQEKLVKPINNSSAVLMVTFLLPTFLICIEQDLGSILTYGGTNYVMATLFCRYLAMRPARPALAEG